MLTQAKAALLQPRAFTATHVLTLPKSTKEALHLPQWLFAMQKEIATLTTNKTWVLTSLPPGIQPIGCKWIFKIKYNADDSFQQNKARLVAKGFHKQPGFDYFETFTPVIKHVTIRIILTLALQLNWFVHQIDINNAFLYCDLEESVYMVQPPGFETGDSNTVCKLTKALYGLKQPPRTWFHKLSAILISLGFNPTKSDTFLFLHFHNNITLFILIYVDDILTTGNSNTAIQRLIHSLNQHFALKNLDTLHYFLGVEATWTLDGGLHLSQTKYILDLLHKTNMLSSKPQPTPMLSTSCLTKDATSVVDDPSLYQTVVGSLQSLVQNLPIAPIERVISCTTPNITTGMLLNAFFAT